MPIIGIYMGGPIPEMGDTHPQKYVQSLGCKVLQFEGSLMASEVAMEIDKLPEIIPACITVLDDWPRWAKTTMQIRKETE